MSAIWNLWHGCKKFSEGCENCYVYRSDAKYDRDASVIKKNSDFNLPVRKNRKGEYKIPPGETVYTCFTSDFLLSECDEWRKDAWRMIKERPDCEFLFITKRIERFSECLPEDWGSGYRNVAVYVTCENQARADQRLPILAKADIVKKGIVCEPLLGGIDLSPYLGEWVDGVIAGGESGEKARLCRYSWVMKIRDDCIKKGIPFCFKQTGAKFEKDGRIYYIKRKNQHSQAKKAGLDFNFGIPGPYIFTDEG